MNRLIRDEAEEAPPQRALPVTPMISAEAQSEQRKPSPRTSRPRRQGKGPYIGRRQITANIDAGLFKRLKLMAVQNDILLVDIYEQALTEYVQRYAAEKKFSTEIAHGLRMVRNAHLEACPVTAHVSEDLFRWARAIHIQTRKTMGFVLEEALTEYAQRAAAQKKFTT